MSVASETDLSLTGSVVTINEDYFILTTKDKRGVVFDNKIFNFNSVRRNHDGNDQSTYWICRRGW